MDRVKTFLVKPWTWCILHGFEKRKKKEKWTANIWLVSTAIVIKLLYLK
jgi:hypothetical protein